MLNFRLLFLGTCARDFSPKLQNEYKDCFDKDARRSSCALLDGHILIDAGTHILDSLRIAGIEKSGITDLVITHLHDDHFCPENIEVIAKSKKDKLRLYLRYDADCPEIENTEIIKMNNFERYNIDGFEVTGLPSNHERDVCPRWLLFEKEGKKLLYATDGAWIVNETYYFLKNAELDVLVMDCTCGDNEGEYRIAEHNTIPMIKLLLPSYKTMRIINDETKIFMTHIAPSLHNPHDEIQKAFAGDNVTVAFDGLKIEL